MATVWEAKSDHKAHDISPATCNLQVNISERVQSFWPTGLVGF